MRRTLLAGAALCFAGAVAAERLHVVIPAGPGGGLDGVARETGRLLVAQGLAERISFENVSGGGGGRAMAYFIDNAGRFAAPLLVNSTPLVVRSLQGLFPYSFRDLTPVAALVADYGILVVRSRDGAEDWPAMVAMLEEDPRSVAVGGGSARGSLDHIVLALALEAAGIEPSAVRYLPYDGGGKAMLALLGGEVDLLATGLGETMPFIDAGQARVLAVTAPQRIEAVAQAPTFAELGYPVVFANWRGLFGPKDMPPDALARHLDRVRSLRATDAWRELLQRRGWAPLVADGAAFTAFLDAQETALEGTLRKLGFVR